MASRLMSRARCVARVKTRSRVVYESPRRKRLGDTRAKPASLARTTAGECATPPDPSVRGFAPFPPLPKKSDVRLARFLCVSRVRVLRDIAPHQLQSTRARDVRGIALRFFSVFLLARESSSVTPPVREKSALHAEQATLRVVRTRARGRVARNLVHRVVHANLMFRD